MCPPVDAAIAPDVFWPETVEHMLITCSNVQLAEVRERLRRQLTDLATRCDTSAAPAPDFRHDTALLTAFMLASGTGPMPTVQSAAVAVGTPEQRRDGPQINFDPAVARSTSAWISALTERWVSSHRTARGTENPDVLPGGQLVSFVLRAVAQMFTVHNHVCRSKINDDYRPCTESVAPVAGGGAAGAAGGAQSGADCATTATAFTSTDAAPAVSHETSWGYHSHVVRAGVPREVGRPDSNGGATCSCAGCGSGSTWFRCSSYSTTGCRSFGYATCACGRPNHFFRSCGG